MSIPHTYRFLHVVPLPRRDLSRSPLSLDFYRKLCKSDPSLFPTFPEKRPHLGRYTLFHSSIQFSFFTHALIRTHARTNVDETHARTHGRPRSSCSTRVVHVHACACALSTAAIGALLDGGDKEMCTGGMGRWPRFSHTEYRVVSENQSVSQSLSQAAERARRGGSPTSSSPFVLGKTEKTCEKGTRSRSVLRRDFAETPLP